MHVCNILDICHGDSCGACITVFNVFAGLDRASILLGVAVYLFSTSVSSVFMVLYIYLVFLVHPLPYLLVRWDWPLTWLTNHVLQGYDTVGWVI